MTFVVGVDTAVRIVEHRFYGHEQAMLRSLEELRQLECRFLVAARSLQGELLRLRDVAVPARFEELFIELPESRFRLDISSSSLRDVGGDHS